MNMGWSPRLRDGGNRQMLTHGLHANRGRAELPVMSEQSSTPTGRLVEFLRSLEIEKLPETVLQQARVRILDGLGCGL